MEIILNEAAKQKKVSSLGITIVPVVYDPKTYKFAQPNTSLAHKGEVVWGCADWMIFHKRLVEGFIAGRFASQKKYTKEQAIELSNQVFRQHWERNATFFSSLRACGYASEFFSYFKSVGLNDVLNAFQQVANIGTKAIDTVATSTTKVIDSSAKTLVNVVDDTGRVVTNLTDGAGNITQLAKYAIPVLIGGVVIFVGAHAYKNFIKGDGRISVPTPGGIIKV